MRKIRDFIPGPALKSKAPSRLIINLTAFFFYDIFKERKCPIHWVISTLGLKAARVSETGAALFIYSSFISKI